MGWHATCDIWHLTHDTFDFFLIHIFLFCLFLSVLVTVILSAHLGRFSVSRMQDFFGLLLLSAQVQRFSFSRMRDFKLWASILFVPNYTCLPTFQLLFTEMLNSEVNFTALYYRILWFISCHCSLQIYSVVWMIGFQSKGRIVRANGFCTGAENLLMKL